MFMHGMSLNVMSLGGLAMGVGVLLDNSVVVMESIFRCQEEGDGLLDAANRGTEEVLGRSSPHDRDNGRGVFAYRVRGRRGGALFRTTRWWSPIRYQPP